jgi:hypothetical protein
MLLVPVPVPEEDVEMKAMQEEEVLLSIMLS